MSRKEQNEPTTEQVSVGETWGNDEEREHALFARMDTWSPEGNGFGIHEDMKFLRRRLEDARAELERVRNHNIQLLRRKPRRGCIQGP